MPSNFNGNLDLTLTNRILATLRNSPYWREATKENGRNISRLICPECGDKEAWAYSASPLSINCNRLDNCGARSKVFDLFPELRANAERDCPPTPEDPHAPARYYLGMRGFVRSLAGLEFEYWKDVRGLKTGAVMFPIVTPDGSRALNGRLFDPPKGEGKTHNHGSTSGAYWKHPGIEYDRGKETFVTEGILNALALIEMGFQAVAVLAAGQDPGKVDMDGFTIVLAFDNDLAGWKGLANWRRQYPEAPAILPPHGQDWNDFLVHHGPEAGEEFTKQRPKMTAGTDDESIAEAIRAEELRKKIEKELAAMNKEYAVIMMGGKFRIMREFEEPIFDRPSFELSSKDDFTAFFSNRLIENPEKGKRGQRDKASLASLWLRWPKRRQYKGIVFNPPPAPGIVTETPDYYNLWRGFGIQPKPGDWSLLREHIWTNIVSENEEHFRWLLAWMARLVQSPGGERPGTAVVLKGKRGTGKGTLVSQFAPIFGPHYLHLMNQVHLTGRFNGHLKNAVLVFCDEGFWAGDKSGEGVLKGMITEPVLPAEDKNEKLIWVKNNVNLFIASNNDWIIPTGLEERRFFVLETSDAHIQDKPYFKAIAEQMERGGREAFLHDLLEMDISGIDLRAAPKTQALLEQIEAGMNPVQRWWYQCLIDGANVSEPPVSGAPWLLFVETKALYNAFIEHTRRSRPSAFIMDQAQFVRQLRDMAPGIQPFRPRDGGAQKRGYTFPTVEECRNEFEKRLGIGVEWDEV